MGDSKFMRIVRYTESFFMILGISTIVVLVLSNVVIRFVFRSGFLWGEELIGFSIVLTVMLGAARALREDQHTALTYFLNKMPPRLQIVVNYIIDLLMATFLMIILYSSVLYALGSVDQMSFVLRIPMAIPYSFIPLGCVCILLELVTRTVDKTTSLIRKGDGTQ